METDRKHIIEKTWVNVCRFLLGVTFIFSGFVKAVDPLGSFYKIQDYLEAFGLLSWVPPFMPLLFGIGLAAIEFCIGVFLFLGIRRSMASWVALLLMCFMTPLTLYLAIADPVSDCGCFGDAVVLTNWQTFGKNVVLLVAAVFAFKGRKLIIRFISHKSAWMVSMYTLLFIFVSLALGLLISVIASTQQEALLISGMGLMIPTMIFSGIIFPCESMPVILQYVSDLLPAKWFIMMAKKVMIQGVGLDFMLTEFCVLSAMAVILLIVSVRLFKERLQ